MTFLNDTDKKPQFRTDAGKTSPSGKDQRRPSSAIASISSDRGHSIDYGRDAAGSSGILVVQEDTIIIGEIRNCRLIEVHGYVEGELSSEMVLVHNNGRLHGTIRTDSAEIHGTLQGYVFVNNLINVRSTGTVNGKVEYGQIAVEPGGILSAEFRNVPPTLAGDFDLLVDKGGSVVITTAVLTAVDPDDDAADLTYTISNMSNGFVAQSDALSKPIQKFTQENLEAGKICFVHNNTETILAGFDVVVTDASGATSGAAQTVKVDVRSK